MSFFEPVIIGTLQGILEWLPVSSEGIISLVLMNFFGKTFSESIFLSIWLHSGTLLAAIVYFSKDIAGILKNIPEYKIKDSKNYNRLTTFLIISTVFTGIVGAPILIFGINEIEISLKVGMLIIGIFLMITGLLQKYSKIFVSNKKELSIWDSVIVGLVQGFSVMPGLSRSGLTTSVLLFENYKPEKALKLSFLMSIPAILVAEIGLGILGEINISIYSIIAIFFSFIFGLATIKTLIRVAEKIEFGWFCIIIGILSVLSFFL